MWICLSPKKDFKEVRKFDAARSAFFLGLLISTAAGEVAAVLICRHSAQHRPVGPLYPRMPAPLSIAGAC